MAPQEVSFRRHILAVLIVAAVNNIAFAFEPPSIGPNVGEMYPDVLLPTLDGKYGHLSNYKGKKVLLIHFASW